MSKTFRLLRLIGVILVLLVVGFAIFVNVRGIPSYPVPVVAAVLPSTPARVAHGQQIAAAMCVHCHLDPATVAVTGRFMPDLGTDLGKLRSKNITQDATHGIGKWTDEQIVGMLRTGIGPDGQYRMVMPHFAYLSDEDAASLVAFLRSDDSMVKANPTPNKPQELSFLAKALTNTVMKPTPLQTHLATAPPASQPVALGHYLVTGRYQCYYCHSGDFSTNDEVKPENSKNYLAGGNELLDDNLKPRVSRNLTMDPETGLGKWTEKQFGDATRYGVSPHGPVLLPMPKFSTMTDAEVHAIWEYLKTVPKIKNATPEDGALAVR